MNKKNFILILFIIFIFQNCAVNPVTGKKELSFMSESQEISIGAEYYPVYTQISGGDFPDQNMQDYVSRVGRGIAVKTHRQNLIYDFNVLNTGVPNAYALPGGKISITRGLLAKMRTEDELAGVLGHELGHVNARHTANQYSKSMILQAIMLGGAYYLQKKNVKHSEIYMAAGMLGSSLLLMKYSRDDERQADALGVEYMAKAGYNPRGFIDAMNIIKSLSDREPSKFEALLSTHPLTSERLNNLTNLVNQSYRNTAAIPYKTQEFANATRIFKDAGKAYESFDKALTLAGSKKYNEAENELNAAIQMYNKDPLFYAHLADIKIDRKDYKTARKYADYAVSVNPTLFVSRLTAGVAQTELHDYSASIQNLTAADKIIKDNYIVLYYLGKSYDNSRDFKNAVGCYKKVLQLTDNKDYAEYAEKRLRILAPEEFQNENKEQKK